MIKVVTSRTSGVQWLSRNGRLYSWHRVRGDADGIAASRHLLLHVFVVVFFGFPKPVVLTGCDIRQKFLPDCTLEWHTSKGTICKDLALIWDVFLEF